MTVILGTCARAAELARSWINTAQERNYWTCAPKFCDRFRAGELTFYYRDYSSKTHWLGDVNNRGVPIVQEAGGETFCHPMAVAQKALGHWNLWQENHRSQNKHLESFLSLALWLCESQEPAGGWAIDCLRKPKYLVPYSAMAQGQIVSVLVRASSLSQAKRYRNAGRRGIEFMLMPIDCGGTSRLIPEGLLLEEYARNDCDGVLNGWINAAFGLYDYLLVQSDPCASVELNSTLQTLVACLPRYDLGFWSKYDLRGTIASPYYQNVHIAQLTALELAFPAFRQEFQAFRRRLEIYSGSRICKMRAVANKAVQRALNPPEIVLKLPTSGYCFEPTKAEADQSR